MLRPLNPLDSFFLNPSFLNLSGNSQNLKYTKSSMYGGIIETYNKLLENSKCKPRGQIFTFHSLGILTAVTGDCLAALPRISINICLIELLTNACKNKQDLHALSLINRIKITRVIHQIS